MNYDNTNRFAVWPNDNKRPDKQDADFTGNVNVTCPHCQQSSDHYMNGWKRKPDAKPGSPSLSGSVKSKDSQRAPNPNPPPKTDDFGDTEIPF